MTRRARFVHNTCRTHYSTVHQLLSSANARSRAPPGTNPGGCRQAKASRFRDLPCKSFTSISAWLEIAMTAPDLLVWTRLIGFHDEPDLASCEVAAFR